MTCGTQKEQPHPRHPGAAGVPRAQPCRQLLSQPCSRRIPRVLSQAGHSLCPHQELSEAAAKQGQPSLPVWIIPIAEPAFSPT